MARYLHKLIVRTVFGLNARFHSTPQHGRSGFGSAVAVQLASQLVQFLLDHVHLKRMNKSVELIANQVDLGE